MALADRLEDRILQPVLERQDSPSFEEGSLGKVLVAGCCCVANFLSTWRLPIKRDFNIHHPHPFGELKSALKKRKEQLSSSLQSGTAESLPQPGAHRYKSHAMKAMSGQKEQDNSFLRSLIHSNSFELATGCLILSCAIIMALDIEWTGKNVGNAIGLSRFDRSGYSDWPGFREHVDRLEVFYCIAFTLEWALRFAAMRCQLFLQGWALLDLALVVCSWLEQLATLALPIDPKLLRMARLARIARLVKMLRSMHAFDTFVILLRSVQASVGILVFSFLLIVLVNSSVAIVMCEVLQEYIMDEAQPQETRQLVFKYFGTFVNGARLFIIDL